MRLSVLADQVLDLITRHPFAAGSVALGAALFSWLATRSNNPAG